MTSELAASRNWGQVLWCSDSSQAIQLIISIEPPLCWEAKYEVLCVREIFALYNRGIIWRARSTNRAADVLAKFSIFSDFSFALMVIWFPFYLLLSLTSCTQKSLIVLLLCSLYCGVLFWALTKVILTRKNNNNNFFFFAYFWIKKLYFLMGNVNKK